MKICEKCGRIVSYNSYFKAYYCDQCGHYEPKKDTKVNTEVIKGFSLHKLKVVAYSK
jgi:DNA-directed RNA polymerase subunit M/transcription elongation factor TFIIS